MAGSMAIRRVLRTSIRRVHGRVHPGYHPWQDISWPSGSMDSPMSRVSSPEMAIHEGYPMTGHLRDPPQEVESRGVLMRTTLMVSSLRRPALPRVEWPAVMATMNAMMAAVMGGTRDYQG